MTYDNLDTHLRRLSEHVIDGTAVHEALLAAADRIQDREHAIEKLIDAIEHQKRALHDADNAVARQRAAFLKWRDLVQAVTTAADIQTCPPASHALGEMDRWRAGLTEEEAEALSAALEIAAHCRRGDPGEREEQDLPEALA